MQPEAGAVGTTGDKPPLKVRRSLCWAVLWVGVDGFVMGQFTCTMLCTMYVLFYALPRALIAYKIRERRNYYLIRAAVFGAVPVLVGVIFTANLKMAARNAATVIAAVERYHADTRQYPQSLQALVPQYLPEIPRAKYVYVAGDFHYSSRENRVQLMYATVPPYGGTLYDFNTRSWSDLD